MNTERQTDRKRLVHAIIKEKKKRKEQQEDLKKESVRDRGDTMGRTSDKLEHRGELKLAKDKVR